MFLSNQAGLTTTKAPFIEKARKTGQLWIEQPYELYTEENQHAWRALYQLLRPKWEKYAHEKFLEGISSLCLDPHQIPKLEDVNRFLAPLTGFRAKAVSGYVPTFSFFESLRNKEFPTTITIRDGKKLHYLPEPDIFHDIAGHVPMHTDPTFAQILTRFGSLATQVVQRQRDKPDRKEKIESNLRALSRFFWFTIEFGLMKAKEGICVYGSGLLSSADEIEHAIESLQVHRYPFQLEWVIHQSFAIDRFQPLLFVIDSFEHLYAEVDCLEKWLMEGKLDCVSFGDPKVQEEEITKFN